MIDNQIKVRLANKNEVENLFSIWLDGIDNSFDTSNIDIPSLRKKFNRNFSNRDGIFNFGVAVDNAETILGWQSLIKTSNNPFREDIYAESSTYLAKDCKYRGLGQVLLTHVIKEAEKTDLQYIIGFVAKENEAARKITKETGWIEVGEIPASKKALNTYSKIFMIKTV